MAGTLYAVTFSNVAVTALQDLFEYTAPSTRIAIIHSIEVAQHTDLGDAASEGFGIVCRRGNTTSGTGGTQTVTPVPLEAAGPAAAGVADINNTTKASGGSPVNVHASAWNIAVPFLWVPTPECRHYLAPSQRYCVELVGSTPADSISMSGTMIVEEIGS